MTNNTTVHQDALSLVHEEAGRTLSKSDFDLCMRIAKRALLTSPRAAVPSFSRDELTAIRGLLVGSGYTALMSKVVKMEREAAPVAEPVRMASIRDFGPVPMGEGQDATSTIQQALDCPLRDWPVPEIRAQAVAADGAQLDEDRIDWIANAHCPGGTAYPVNVKNAIREALRAARAAVSPATADERAAWLQRTVLEIADQCGISGEALARLAHAIDTRDVALRHKLTTPIVQILRASQAAAPAEVRPTDDAEEMRDAAMRTVQAMGLVYSKGSDRWRPQFGDVPADAGEAVANELTNAMIDAARPLFLALECGATSIDAVRHQMKQSGVDVDLLPKWFSRDSGHLTKAGRAIIAWYLMKGAQGGKGDEA